MRRASRGSWSADDADDYGERDGREAEGEQDREAGREPVERDTLYRPVVRTQTAVSVQL